MTDMNTTAKIEVLRKSSWLSVEERRQLIVLIMQANPSLRFTSVKMAALISYGCLETHKLMENDSTFVYNRGWQLAPVAITADSYAKFLTRFSIWRLDMKQLQIELAKGHLIFSPDVHNLANNLLRDMGTALFVVSELALSDLQTKMIPIYKEASAIHTMILQHSTPMLNANSNEPIDLFLNGNKIGSFIPDHTSPGFAYFEDGNIFLSDKHGWLKLDRVESPSKWHVIPYDPCPYERKKSS